MRNPAHSHEDVLFPFVHFISEMPRRYPLTILSEIISGAHANRTTLQKASTPGGDGRSVSGIRRKCLQSFQFLYKGRPIEIQQLGGPILTPRFFRLRRDPSRTGSPVVKIDALVRKVDRVDLFDPALR
jgi:hypothetical protein